MRQLPKENLATQEVLDQGGSTSQMVSIFIFIGNLLLSFSLQNLLSMINAVQFIIFLPLFNVMMPANAGMFYNKLTALAIFDVFDMSILTTKLFDIVPTDPVNMKFNTVGLSDLYFIHNIGSFFMVITVYFALVLFWLLLYPCSMRGPKRIVKLRKWISRSLFWNSISMVIFEQYLAVALCGLVSLRYHFKIDDLGSLVQTIACLVTFACYMLMPVLLLAFVTFRFSHIDTPQM